MIRIWHGVGDQKCIPVLLVVYVLLAIGPIILSLFPGTGDFNRASPFSIFIYNVVLCLLLVLVLPVGRQQGAQINLLMAVW
jgi:hypothetical protein